MIEKDIYMSQNAPEDGCMEVLIPQSRNLSSKWFIKISMRTSTPKHDQMHFRILHMKVITQAKRLELNIPTVSLSRTYNTLRRLHHGMYYRSHRTCMTT